MLPRRFIAQYTALQTLALVLFLSIITQAIEAQVRSGPGGLHHWQAGPPALENNERERPAELSCKLRTFRPYLDFEFRFLTGYRVEIPIRELVGPANVLQISMEVEPVSTERRKTVQLDEQVRVAAIEKGHKGEIELSGSFVVGEGSYDVRWRLQDRAGRFCNLSWKVNARLSRRERNVQLTMAPGEVASSLFYLFREESAVRGGPSERQLRVKVLVNFDVQSRRQVTIQLWRYAPLISILRVLSRHPSTVEFSVVAYSLEEQKILHRQKFADHIDFPALGDATEGLSPATVALRQLGKGKEVEFFRRLLETEMRSEQADAFVFVGRDAQIGKKIPQQTLRALREMGDAVFYLNWTRHPWRGVIGNAVKSLRGTEYKVRSPRQLSSAVEKMVSRISERRGASPK